jgi:hypothetical protein
MTIKKLNLSVYPHTLLILKPISYFIFYTSVLTLLSMGFLDIASII